MIGGRDEKLRQSVAVGGRRTLFPGCTRQSFPTRGGYLWKLTPQRPIEGVVTALAIATGSEDPDTILNSPGSGVVIILGMVMLNLAPLAGLGLGIAGLVSKGRRRTFPVLGLVFNALMVGLMVLFWWVGRA